MTVKHILAQMLGLRRQGRQREADAWVTALPVGHPYKLVFVRCMDAENAGRRFQIGHRLPLIRRRPITKHDVGQAKRGWHFNGRSCRRMAALVYGAAYVRAAKINQAKPYIDAKNEPLA